MNRGSSSTQTSSTKGRRAKRQSEADDPLKSLHVYRVRLAARFGNNMKRLCEYLDFKPLPPGFRRAPSARMRPEES
jgi:hypothetical protein